MLIISNTGDLRELWKSDTKGSGKELSLTVIGLGGSKEYGRVA